MEFKFVVVGSDGMLQRAIGPGSARNGMARRARSSLIIESIVVDHRVLRSVNRQIVRKRCDRRGGAAEVVCGSLSTIA